MKPFLFKFVILSVILIGFPLGGVYVSGLPISRYLEFPPLSQYLRHSPFYWPAFCAYLAFILLATIPLVIPWMTAAGRKKNAHQGINKFPWWGWSGLTMGAVFWFLAWTRFEWFSFFQPHTFTPLWISYIITVNALKMYKTGYCMMIRRPGYFLLLFPVSAVFWWFFEYLNRFVQNWRYEGVHFSSWEYFCYATLSFSTVLPAVLGTRDLILTSSRFQKIYQAFVTVRWPYPRLSAFTVLLISSMGLALIGIHYDLLFPLLWISPVLVMISLQILMKESHILSELVIGDWTLVLSSSLAALICGWFWEMWNYYSLARWVYQVPFVHRFQVFEMPVLGFAGYLPFGLECAVIGRLLEQIYPSWKRNQ